MPLETFRQREGWTVQLIAGNLETTILNILARAPGDSRLVYTRAERDGSPWFMLAYGQYSNAEEARAASGNLPRALGVSSPWVRSFNSY